MASPFRCFHFPLFSLHGFLLYQIIFNEVKEPIRGKGMKTASYVINHIIICIFILLLSLPFDIFKL